jgi:hypothetical protein
MEGTLHCCRCWVSRNLLVDGTVAWILPLVNLTWLLGERLLLMGKSTSTMVLQKEPTSQPVSWLWILLLPPECGGLAFGPIVVLNPLSKKNIIQLCLSALMVWSPDRIKGCFGCGVAQTPTYFTASYQDTEPIVIAKTQPGVITALPGPALRQ